MSNEISPDFPYQKKTTSVLGTQIAYVDDGSGSSVVFLHGNPTSSYLWRNVMPHVAASGRILAPDLVGMGDSGPSTDGGYRFVDHARYLDAWLEKVAVGSNVVLVVHDWGSALGFDWASRHPGRVKGIAYMEAIVCPLEWDDWPESARSIFQGMRSPAGETLVLEKNVFVERILPASVIRTLSDAEMAEYRRPYVSVGESRRPTLTWPREIPVGGEPADVVEVVRRYGDWLSTSPVPKLFVNAEPGSILTGRQREYCRNWPNQREVTVPGNHFLQEDSPHEIGEALATWMRSL
jgi:haloalkane dehalogenase